MLSLRYSKKFKKELKLFKNDKIIISELDNILDFLIFEKPLPKKYLNHGLKGEFKGCFECHIKSDVLLIYKMKKEEVCIILLRPGSHSDLF
ncbi:MAG: type II toxin-antitoxin system YafQ family toxin [Patescibacteria group bacterium]|jgi:mRNA interferase YafQ|nr:type II toxin-antitoxin system YafQ family toxin [Patescibacteria group bacterium]